MLKTYISIIFLLFLMQYSSCEDYSLFLLSQERGAACLDGSPIGLYIHQGKGQQSKNFLISFDSGGFCGAGSLSDTLEACYQRSSTSLGSTKNCKPFKNFDQDGLLSTNPLINPVFYNWTKVFGIYCDGAQYFGSRSQPVSYKDKKLYFRGTNNVLEQIKYLQDKYDMFRKNKIVITGVSAGGIATYLYSNYILQKTITAKIYAIPDSGLFLTDYYSPLANQKIIRQKSKALVELAWSTSTFPLTECLKDFDNDALQCFNAVNLARYLKAPMLIVQSPYDAWSISNLIGAQCLKNKSPYSLVSCNQAQMQAINDYRDAVRDGISQILKIKNRTGVWAPSCVQHGFSDTTSFNNQSYRVPYKIGKQVSQTILQFLQNPQSPPLYIDTVNWPDNQGCNGIKENFSFKKIYNLKKIFDKQEQIERQR